LAGIKIGVSTVIRINHKSIGMTNDEWEANRAGFAEKFKEQLPVSIKRKLRKGESLKVLIGCLSFANLTGSELYVFELAKALTEKGCDVSICSNLGQPLSQMAKKYGIKLYSFNEPPSFKLGDGVWKLTSHLGDEVISQPNTLYKISEDKFDIIHLNHKPVTEHLLKLYPNTPVVCSIHSEVISLEEPVISPNIKKYIAIRPEIKEHIVSKFRIDESLVDVVYNPIDSNKFKPLKNTVKKDKKRILFVGTIDYLRKQTIKDLIETTKQNNEELWLVGKINGVELTEFDMDNHVKYFPPTQNIEKYFHECDETAGILLGRTTIEGWMCGKKGWIYDIDNNGNILSKKLYDIPSDIDKFKVENVINEIMSTYENVLE
jgi:hypothetical protein